MAKYITLDNLNQFLINLQDVEKRKFVASGDNFGCIRIGYSQNNKNYPVELDNDGKAFINAPWINTTYDAGNGLMLSYYTGNPNSPRNISLNINSYCNNTPSIYPEVENRCYAVQLDNSGVPAVNVPWTNTTVIDEDHHYFPANGISQQRNTGIYKFSIDDAGHLYNATAATADDIIEICPGLSKIEDVFEIAESISWGTLKSYKDNGKLVPGKQYRINNYMTSISTKYIQLGYAQSSYYFDVIVEAVSKTELSEYAKAAPRTQGSETYFRAKNLSTWELKYCIDNDTTRFDWAAPDGTGVIYYMKDEHGNEAGFDFKNIKFDGYYLFSSYNMTSEVINDASVVGYNSTRVAYPKNNIIHNSLGLNNWVSFILCHDSSPNLSEINVSNNYISFDSSSKNSVSYFINNNYNNIIKNTLGNLIFRNAHDNTLESLSSYIKIGDDTLEDSFALNSILNENNCNNIFKSCCSGIHLGKNCHDNTFNINCKEIILEENCNNNTFGTCSSNIKLSKDSSYNKSANNQRNSQYNNESIGWPSYSSTYTIYCGDGESKPILTNCILGRYCYSTNVNLTNIVPTSSSSTIKNMFNSDSSFKYQNYKLQNLEFVDLGSSQQIELNFGNIFNKQDYYVIRRNITGSGFVMKNKCQ